jgi:LysR family transcriptional regulator, benzoate and cis,cis-muconate-responsive activator of ben and cat genes
VSRQARSNAVWLPRAYPQGMELRHLRYFTAVYDEGTIGRAAERLLISQPALTRQIHVLEREIGTPLFERVASGMRPTAAGSALQSHALQVLRLADATREVARSAVPVLERVEIGLPPAPQPWLHDALQVIRREVPQAAVAFTDASSAEQLRMVGEGRIDIAIVHQQPPGTMHHRLLFEQPFGVAARPGHRLTEQGTCSLTDLDDVRVLVHAREQVPGEHDRMITIANEIGITPHWRFARFSENAFLCAEATKADAVLLSEPSAARTLPDWPWRQLINPTVYLRTWATRLDRTRIVVVRAMETLCRAATTATPDRSETAQQRRSND